MKILEIFSPQYVVKKVSHTEFDVSKFEDRKQPSSTYRVTMKGNKFWTDSPGYVHRGQDDKHIKVVKQFIADHEPQLTAYSIDAAGTVTRNKFG